MSNSNEPLYSEVSQNPKDGKADNTTEGPPRKLGSCLGAQPRNSNTPRFLFGLIERRECWSLTWTGRLVTMVILTIITALCMRGLCGFLSITSPTGGQFLVVEGWMSAYAYREAISEFSKGGYRKIIAAGTMHLDGDTGEPREFFGAGKLIGLGVPSDLVVMASLRGIKQRDRTFHSAMAVKEWLQEQRLQTASIDVITIGPHARRSRLIYEKALGNKFKVGIIAIRDRGFDPTHWWQSSEGVRTVIGETIAYLYVRIFFSLPCNNLAQH